MISRIYSVTSVSLILLKSNPPGLQATALGMATTTGWSKPALVPFIYLVPPADRILDCDFVAMPPDPSTPVLQVLTPIIGTLVIPNIDLENYWGPGLPLRGVRCHSVANTKTALTDEKRPGMAAMRIVESEGAATTPSFATDIKPLFRPQDVTVMRAVSGFDLHVYDDVVAHADKILERLETNNPVQSMPCDGRWPQTDIDLFRAWIDAKTPA